jgi:hypothetical protein
MIIIVRNKTNSAIALIINSMNRSFFDWELNIMRAAMVPGPEIMGIANGNTDGSSFSASAVLSISLDRDGLAKIRSIEIINNNIPPDIKKASGDTPRYNNINLPKKIKKIETTIAVKIDLKIILLLSTALALEINITNIGINPNGSTAMNNVKNIEIIEDICIIFYNRCCIRSYALTWVNAL